MIGKLIKWVFTLGVFFVLGIFGYAIFGDLSAPSREVSKEITINVD